MINWFGPSWGGTINDDTPRCETPVDCCCARCEVAFVDGDQGVTMPLLGDGTVGVAAYHLDCFRKSITDHSNWPLLGLVPGQGDGFLPAADDCVRCPTCGMTYSTRLARWVL